MNTKYETINLEVLNNISLFEQHTRERELLLVKYVESFLLNLSSAITSCGIGGVSSIGLSKETCGLRAVGESLASMIIIELLVREWFAP